MTEKVLHIFEECSEEEAITANKRVLVINKNNFQVFEQNTPVSAGVTPVRYIMKPLLPPVREKIIHHFEEVDAPTADANGDFWFTDNRCGGQPIFTKNIEFAMKPYFRHTMETITVDPGILDFKLEIHTRLIGKISVSARTLDNSFSIVTKKINTMPEAEEEAARLKIIAEKYAAMHDKRIGWV